MLIPCARVGASDESRMLGLLQQSRPVPASPGACRAARLPLLRLLTRCLFGRRDFLASLGRASTGSGRRRLDGQRLVVGIQRGTVFGEQRQLEFALQLALTQRRLPAGATRAQVRATTRLLAGRVQLDMAGWGAHDADQLALGPHLPADDAGALWDVLLLRLLLFALGRVRLLYHALSSPHNVTPPAE